MTWQPIETAPKDGRAVLLLSAPQDVDMGPNGHVHYRPRAAIGSWVAEGTSWVDQHGHIGGCVLAEVVELAETGIWACGTGWFQPNEVTHWHPLPELPERSL